MRKHPSRRLIARFTLAAAVAALPGAVGFAGCASSSPEATQGPVGELAQRPTLDANFEPEAAPAEESNAPTTPVTTATAQPRSEPPPPAPPMPPASESRKSAQRELAMVGGAVAKRVEPQSADKSPARQRAEGPAKDSLARGDDDTGAAVAPLDEGGTFVHHGMNPLVDPRQDKLSTFAVDVDTGSYTLARRYLEGGSQPPAASVRVEEWVNAFHYGYDGPKSDIPFAIHLEAAPLAKGSHLVRVGLQGKRIAKADRAPVNLVFLADVSGSMGGADRLPLAQKTLHILVDELNEKDSVSLVTYAGNTGVVLPATAVSAQNKAKIHQAIDNLQSGGGTGMSSGMELAYREAAKGLAHKGVSRVIVLSDGDANIGRTSHQEMLKAVNGYVSEGVTLSTVGFGTGNLRDHLMEQLANAGNGNYSYIDGEKAARRVFVEDLTGTLQVIAQDVKVQVEMNDEVVSKYRLIGYENRDVADKDFRNDKVDAGEIGAGHTVTALYEVQLKEGAVMSEDVATVRVRWKQPRGTKASETQMSLTAQQLVSGDLDGAAADTRFALAAALAAEVFRGSEHPKRLGLGLTDAYRLAKEAAVGPHAQERQELVKLLAPFAGTEPMVRR